MKRGGMLKCKTPLFSDSRMEIPKLFLLAAMLTVLFGCFVSNSYAAAVDAKKTESIRDGYVFKLFVPIVHDGSGDHLLIDAPQLLSKEFMASMERYLVGTGYVSVRIKGHLYIEKALADDRELLYNFTNKALDQLSK